jgi:ABC-type bacteriocin/lantibiotic exporter with double-glycine peptidase domain
MNAVEGGIFACRQKPRNVSIHVARGGMRQMEQLLNQILSNTLYTIIAVALLAVLAYAVIKKVLKLALIVVLLFSAYLTYVHYAGGNVKQAATKTIEAGTEAAKEVKKKVEESKEVQDVKRKIEEKLKK